METPAGLSRDPELEKIRNTLAYLSGGGKKLAPGMRKNGLYCSMTLPGLDDMPAVRNTMDRFKDFGIPDDLSSYTFIDIGSNVGALALEAARRGAFVTGVEFRQDRVDLCNQMAIRWNLHAIFYQADFNNMDIIEHPWMVHHNIVLCTAVDNYIIDQPAFYKLLRSITGNVLYFECNRGRGSYPAQDTIQNLEEAGFRFVQYLGTGSCPFLRRKIFKAEP